MSQNTLFIDTVLNSWKQAIERATKTFDSLTAEDLQREIAPGRNRAYYLLGHLTATSDRLIPLLRVGDRLHPELDEAFLENSDRSRPDPISAPELKKAWHEVNEKLTAALTKLKPEEWLERHAAVSEEDFAKEPLRNRLAVLISRTTHAAYHLGQLRLAQPN
ncbi:DinB family protein [Edaphobacter bradus]|uniref:DinB family protein n=1 Tax=Edaphobacter bradus TaxID=2259016 RepID=UPI0021E043AD|nr:DinB family protein [Edaphobacter bradus]